MAGAAGLEIRTDLPQQEKISNALAILLDSEVEEGSTLLEYRAALNFIVIAWNVSLMPADRRTEEIQRLFVFPPGCDDRVKREAITHIERLIAKKQDLFPHDKRFVVSWEVRFQGNNFHITAAAVSVLGSAAPAGNRASDNKAGPALPGAGAVYREEVSNRDR
jgi:hypothetical protein